MTAFVIPVPCRLLFSVRAQASSKEFFDSDAGVVALHGGCSLVHDDRKHVIALVQPPVALPTIIFQPPGISKSSSVSCIGSSGVSSSGEFEFTWMMNAL